MRQQNENTKNFSSLWKEIIERQKKNNRRFHQQNQIEIAQINYQYPYSNIAIVRAVTLKRQKTRLGTGFLVNIQENIFLMTVAHHFYQKNKYLKNNCAFIIKQISSDFDIQKDQKHDLLKQEMNTSQIPRYQITQIKEKYLLSQQKDMKKSTIIFAQISQQISKGHLTTNQGFKVDFNWSQNNKDYQNYQIYIMGCSQKHNIQYFKYLNQKSKQKGKSSQNQNEQEIKVDLQNFADTDMLLLFKFKIKIKQINEDGMIYQLNEEYSDVSFFGSPIVIFQQGQAFVVGIHTQYDQLLMQGKGTIFNTKFKQFLIKKFSFLIMKTQNGQKQNLHLATTTTTERCFLDEQKNKQLTQKLTQVPLQNCLYPYFNIAAIYLTYKCKYKNNTQRILLGNGSIINIKGKMYLITLINNLIDPIYPNYFLNNVLVFITESQKKHQGLKIKTQNVIYHQNYLTQNVSQKQKYSIAFLQLKNLIQSKKLILYPEQQGFQPIFEYKYKSSDQIFVMGVYATSKKINKGQQDRSYTSNFFKNCNVFLRKIKVIQTQSNFNENKLIFEKVEDFQLNYGEPLLLKQKGKYFIIGFLIQMDKVINLGLLFSKETQQTILQKRYRLIYNEPMDIQDSPIYQQQYDIQFFSKKKEQFFRKSFLPLKLEDDSLKMQDELLQNLQDFCLVKIYHTDDKYYFGHGMLMIFNQKLILVTAASLIYQQDKSSIKLNCLIISHNQQQLENQIQFQINQRDQIVFNPNYKTSKLSKHNYFTETLQVNDKNQQQNLKYELAYINLERHRQFLQKYKINISKLPNYCNSKITWKQNQDLYLFSSSDLLVTCRKIQEVVKNQKFQYFSYNHMSKFGDIGSVILLKKDNRLVYIGTHVAKSEILTANSKKIKGLAVQLNLYNNKFLNEGAKFIPQYEQNIYPFSNSVILRMIIPRDIHSTKKQFCSSSVIASIQGKKYIVTVCHNLYLQQTWMKSTAFLKIESQLNNVRKKMEIKKQMIHYNKSFLQNGKSQHQITFIEINSQLMDTIKNNNGLEIIFDWHQIDHQQVYLMGFPYKQNSKIIDMTDTENSVCLHLCFRKVKTSKIINNKFLFYQITTQVGEGGGALMVKRQNKFYLIGLHLGRSQQLKVGILFISKLKQKFSQIFIKRERTLPQERKQQKKIMEAQLFAQPKQITTDSKDTFSHMFLNKEKPINQKEQNEQKVAIDFFQYLIKLYNVRNDHGNQSGDAKDWSDFWGRVLKQYLTKLKPLEKNQKCKGTLHRIFSNIKQRKSRYDQLMNVPKRNFQFSESTIAKQLRVHVLPAAQALVKILQGDKKIISVKDLQQYHRPYAWQYFLGGRRQPYQ